ncbi:hypothetical protein [Azospirillum sp. TSO35-2]|uniref:hypothetical protein n=1 Tax=Azospirillum sp. TSO35-2 TaxID=716796 RepID=UPI000D604711|nr:hypothetical protein [Azospirillum sp. TSO35-2]PWC35933.1 hypothetical protein TSO352_12010 [Azospirillum sp. TSO35-2]
MPSTTPSTASSQGASTVVPLRAGLPAGYDPTQPAADRRAALRSALPPAVRALVEERSTGGSRFAADGSYAGPARAWTAPTTVEPRTAQAAGVIVADIRRTILAPCDPAHLLARVYALFAHCAPKSPLPPEVEAVVAADWAEDLGEFPSWAVDAAARQWRRSSRYRPSIAEMRSLCEEACREERELAERLDRIARVSPGATIGMTGGINGGTAIRAGALASMRRMP